MWPRSSMLWPVASCSRRERFGRAEATVRTRAPSRARCGLHRFDAESRERRCGDGADRDGQDAVLLGRGPERLEHVGGLVARDAQQRVRGRGRGEGHRVDPAGADRVHQPLDGRDVGGQGPAVDRDGDGRAAAGAHGADEVLGRVAVQLDRDALAVDAAFAQVLDDFVAGLARRRPLLGEPGGADRAEGLRPAAQDAARGPSRRSRSSPMPQPSAASSQPRKPMPVVATTRSGASRMSSTVAARSASSSGSGTMRSVGATMVRAPRRSSSVASSSARRCAVTATV